MSSEFAMFRTVRFSLAGLVGLFYLGFMVPSRIGAERNGVRRDGIIVRYEPSTSHRYEYPVVRINRDDRIVEARSTTSWRFEWYNVGDHVPVLDVGGRRVYVGSVFVRWGDVMVVLFALGVCAAYLIYRAKRVPSFLTASPAIAP